MLKVFLLAAAFALAAVFYSPHETAPPGVAAVTASVLIAQQPLDPSAILSPAVTPVRVVVDETTNSRQSSKVTTASTGTRRQRTYLVADFRRRQTGERHGDAVISRGVSPLTVPLDAYL